MKTHVNHFLSSIDDNLTNNKYQKFAEPKPKNLHKIKDWEKRKNKIIYNGILNKSFIYLSNIKEYIKDGMKKEITKLIKDSKLDTAPYVLKNLKKHEIL